MSITVYRQVVVGDSHIPTWIKDSTYERVEQAKRNILQMAKSSYFGSTWRIVQREPAGVAAWDSTIVPRQKNMVWSQATPGEYYVHRNGAGVVFVKSREFFLEQKGDTLPWGLSWTRIRAYSIEDARHVGDEVLPQPPKPAWHG